MDCANSDNTTSTDRARVVAHIRLWSLIGSIIAAAISGWISSISGDLEERFTGFRLSSQDL